MAEEIKCSCGSVFHRNICYNCGKIKEAQPVCGKLQKNKKSRKFRKRRVNKETRRLIYERDGNCCLKCGSTENLTIDHVIPMSLGGDNTRKNFQTLCLPCNEKKCLEIIDYRK